MIATSHPQASLAGLDVLDRGGNATDAAVAAAAVLAVVEPAMSGLGGDCFALLGGGHLEQIVAYNGSGRAPMAATIERLHELGAVTDRYIDRFSAHAVTVPGAPQAWAQLINDHGTRGLDELLRPAILAARDGYLVTPRVAHDWSRHAAVLRRRSETRQRFLPRGRSPAVGDRMANTELGDVFADVADHGVQVLYEGRVAEAIVAHLRDLGGLHTVEDWAQHRGEYVEPIHARYADVDVFECPPNGGGVAALQLLNVLSGIDLPALAPYGVERAHLELEAGRLVLDDRDAHVSDPRFGAIAVNRLLSPEYADRLRLRVSPTRRSPGPEGRSWPQHNDTTYVCAVDASGLTISLISSVFGPFGSGIVVPGTGIVLQNRGTGFSLDDAHPNRLEGGKRPMHTIIPAMAVQNRTPTMAFGVVGGDYQPIGQAHILTNMVDYGMDPQAALDAPRVFPDQDRAVVEASYGSMMIEQLRRLGHQVAVADEPIGGAQAIVIDQARGCLIGASDRRKDGVALGR